MRTRWYSRSLCWLRPTPDGGPDSQRKLHPHHQRLLPTRLNCPAVSCELNVTSVTSDLPGVTLGRDNGRAVGLSRDYQFKTASTTAALINAPYFCRPNMQAICSVSGKRR